MKNRITLFLSVLALMGSTGCDEILDEIKKEKRHEPRITTLAQDLTGPLGIETDRKGNLWVTEAGTGQTNDGQLTFITPQGRKFTVVQGFPSEVSPEGGIFGLNHLLLHEGTLYMLHGVEGKLYKYNIANYKPGAAPIQASQLPSEDIGTFVKNYAFDEDTNETDIFNLTVGPGGDIFIVDAAANAIIRRKSGTGQLSVFATIPPVPNPMGDPAQVQAVPTGIVFDGNNFLVCTFTGFPFPANQATIYQVNRQGNATVYQSGLASLTDIELSPDQKPLVVEYGTWTGEGFAENSGALVRSALEKNTRLITDLNFPNSLERGNGQVYYIAQTFDGVIRKINY
ncbi:MAG: ScyD/ScyE family protein [Adhaeribacter sp.]